MPATHALRVATGAHTGAHRLESAPLSGKLLGFMTWSLGWQHPVVQRRLLGLLFAVLATGLGLIAVFAALEGGGAWVIALAAAALAIWLGDLARHAHVRRRR